MDWMDFKLTPGQEAFMRDPGRFMLFGRLSGRTAATINTITATARTPEDAEKAIADLHEHKVALMSDDGRHVPAPKSDGAQPEWIEWDDLESTPENT